MSRRKIERPPDPNPRIPEKLRQQCSRTKCGACGATYGAIAYSKAGHIYVAHEALDHIFPRRFIIQFKLNPHIKWNLLSVCGACHGIKKKAENHLFRCDPYSFVKEVLLAGWPEKRVWVAAYLYGFGEITNAIDQWRERCRLSDKQKHSGTSRTSSQKRDTRRRSGS